MNAHFDLNKGDTCVLVEFDFREQIVLQAPWAHPVLALAIVLLHNTLRKQLFGGPVDMLDPGKVVMQCPLSDPASTQTRTLAPKIGSRNRGFTIN